MFIALIKYGWNILRRRRRQRPPQTKLLEQIDDDCKCFCAMHVEIAMHNASYLYVFVHNDAR